MNQSLWNRILAFLKRKLWNRRWRRAVTCLAAVAVFATTYALILPAITMTKAYPTLQAEQTIAWSGEELAVKVTAASEPGETGKTIVLTAEGEGADLSGLYIFDESGVCVIRDDAGRDIELHRSIREEEVKNAKGEKVDRVDYWFSLAAGAETSFTLQLIDEVDETRFAETVKAVKESSGDTAEKATASDAGKSSAKNTEKKGAAAASASNAKKAADTKATGSNAAKDAAEANKLAPKGEEKIVTEKSDEDTGFVEILDGAVINDLEPDANDDDEEQTEVVANLKLSAGIGEDYEAAVRDAEKNANKRAADEDGGVAELLLQWQDVIAQKAADAKLVSYVNGATIAVFCDNDAEIPAGASLEVFEIEEGTDEYAAYFAQAKAAVANATESDASRTVTQARFFDITIVDEDGAEVEPKSAVKVVITYDEAIIASEDNDMNVVHFKEEETPEVLKPGTVEGRTEVGGLSFTTDSFSVYGFVQVGTITVPFVAGDGRTYEVTVNFDQEAGIPEDAQLQVSEVTENNAKYDEYVEQAADAINSNVGVLNYIKLLDISIVDAYGGEVVPDAPVDVQIRLLDQNEVEDNTQIVHFAGTAEEPVVVESNVEADVVRFEASGFSVYAIIGTASGDPSGTNSVKLEFYYGSENEPQEYSFVNKDGETTNTQYVTSGETMINPGLPSFDGDSSGVAQAFLGWCLYAEGKIIRDSVGNPIAYDFEKSFDDNIAAFKTAYPGLDSDTDEYGSYTVKLIGIYSNAVYVYYYSQKSEKNGENYDIHKISLIPEDGSEDITAVDYVPDSSTTAFLGWSTYTPAEMQTVLEESGGTPRQFVLDYFDDDAGKTNVYEEKISTLTQGHDGTIKICEGTDEKDSIINVYPVIANVYWITYDKNDWVYTFDTKDGAFDVLTATESSGGAYNQVESEASDEGFYYEYVGEGNGTYDVTFKFVGAQKGDYSRASAGSDYVAPMYTLEGETIASSENGGFPSPSPERTGYTFGGWYTDEKCTNEFRETDSVSDASYVQTRDRDDHSLVLYAKWIAAKTAYTVVIWKQSVNDKVTAENKDKTYDFAGAVVIPATADYAKTTGDYITISDVTTTQNGRTNYTTFANIPSVTIGTATEPVSFVGFHYNSTNTLAQMKADAIAAGESVSVEVMADGTSVYNVYYDRDTVNFVYHRNGYTNVYEITLVETEGDEEPQYAKINGEMILLTRNGDSAPYTWTYEDGSYSYSVDNENGEYGLVDGEYVKLEQSVISTDYDYTFRYNYVSTTESHNTYNTQYYINNDNEYDELVWWGGNWYRPFTLNPYTGTRYVQYAGDDTSYTGTRYTYDWWDGYISVSDDAHGSTYYGIDENGAYVELIENENNTYGWTYNGEEYTGDRYSATANVVEYTGTRYHMGEERVYSDFTYTGLYGQSLAQNNYSWPTRNRWNEQSNGGGTTQTLLTDFIPPYNRPTGQNAEKTYYSTTSSSNPDVSSDGVITYDLYCRGESGTAAIYHYIENVGSTDKTDRSNYSLGETAYGTRDSNFNFTNKFNGFEVYGYSDTATGAINTSITNSHGFGDVLYVFHTRNSYELTFADSKSSENIFKETLQYGAALGQFSDQDVSKLSDGSDFAGYDGYAFSGWFADSACSTYVFFGTPSAEQIKAEAETALDADEYSRLMEVSSPTEDSVEKNGKYYVLKYVTYPKMPANNLKVYAGWRIEKYRVWIQANGGQLTPGTGNHATWFNNTYDQLVGKYENVVRNFVPAVSTTPETETRYAYVEVANTNYKGARIALYVCKEGGKYYYYPVTANTEASVGDISDRVELTGDFLTAALETNQLEDGDFRYVYKYNGYSLVGWYKVNKEITKDAPPEILTSDDMSTAWNFGQGVHENVAIRAIWKRTGYLTVVYDETGYQLNADGTITVNSEKDDIPDATNIEEYNKNDYSYADHSQGVTAKAPAISEEDSAKWIFVGWATPNFKEITNGSSQLAYIYDPGSTFTIVADYAEIDDGDNDGHDDDKTADPYHFYFILHPVFMQIGTSSVTYTYTDSAKDTMSGTALTDFGEQLVEKSGKELVPATAGSITTNTVLDSGTGRYMNTISGLKLNSSIRVSDGSGFTRSGYKLIGWNDDAGAADAGTVKYALGYTYGVSSDTNILYAVWIRAADIEITKVDENGDALSGARFTLYSDSACTNAIGSAVSGEDGKVLFQVEVTEAGTQTYYMKESTSPDGYLGNEEIYTVTVTVTDLNDPASDKVTIAGNGGDDTNLSGSQGSYSITNDPKTLTVTVFKTAEDGTTGLTKATFELFKRNTSGTFVKYGAESYTVSPEETDLGRFTENLAAGIYMLKETNAPDGYVILTSQIYFEVYKDTDNVLKVRLTDENGQASSSTDPAQIITSIAESPQYTVIVKNTSGVALPSTGGPGKVPYTLSGMMLLIASALLYGFRMRRRERRLMK